jgi:AcrR family transcriptional regulator
MTNKEKVGQVATRLFAKQGFNGTSTKQIVLKVEVTESLLHYHLDGKDHLFADIFKSSFVQYPSRLDAIEVTSEAEFEKLKRLLFLDLKFDNDFPYVTYLIVSTCPSKPVSYPISAPSSLVKGVCSWKGLYRSTLKMVWFQGNSKKISEKLQIP